MIDKILKLFTTEDSVTRNGHSFSVTKTMFSDKQDILYRSYVDGKPYLSVLIFEGYRQIDLQWTLNNGSVEEFTYFVDDDKFVLSVVDIKRNMIYTNSGIGARDGYKTVEVDDKFFEELCEMLYNLKPLKEIKRYFYKKLGIVKS